MKSHVKEWKRDSSRQQGRNELELLPLPAGGEWSTEPDKVQWIDDATDLDCLMHRAHGGHWCGYVGVPEGHPAFGKEYEHVDVDVHGGLTYADFCQDTGDESYGICHVPEPGRPHRVWWLGFDCAHAGDLSPAHDAIPAIAEIRSRYPRYDVYRNREYVEEEVTKLARQLKDLELAAAP